MSTEYGRYSMGVETNHGDSNADPSATSGEASLFVSGSGTAAKFYQVNGNGDKGTVLTTDIVSGDGTMNAAGALTIAADAIEHGMLNDNCISGFTNLGSATVADSDEFLFCDAGTLKALTFEHLRDSVFADVSGDATVAAGGALTIASTAVEASMLNNNVVSGLTDIGAALATTDELLVSDAGTIRRTDLSRFAPMLAGTVTTSGLADNSGVLQVDVNNLTAETTVTDADLVMIYDATASALRKMTRANFIESAALSAIDIDGGAIDGTPIGASSAAAGTFAALKWSSLSGSGNAEIVGTIASTGAIASSGSITAGSSFIIGSADLNEVDMEKLDGITNGTAAANKALVLDASKNIGTINRLTASYAYIGELDVDKINTVTKTETNLEIVDKLIICASGSNSANSDGAGLQFGGAVTGDAVASIKYDHGNTAIDFSIGTTTEMRLQNGVLRPEADNDVDLGASGAEFKDLYIDGVAYIDSLQADQLGAALDANSQAITNINVDSGNIDGVTIGAASAAAGTFLAVAGTTGTFSGVLKTDDTTEATSTTDGSLQTDGGLSVAKSAVVGDDLDLLSDGAILNFGADKEVNLTHVHDEGLLLNSDFSLMFGDADTSIHQSQDGVLKLEADTGLLFGAPTATFQSATADAPTVAIKNTNADSNPGTLQFQKDSASPAADDELGEIVFNG